MAQFFSEVYDKGAGQGFQHFIPDQMTRWMCGTASCLASINLRQEHLHIAMAKLNTFDNVLILEELDHPDSCTRKQIEGMLNMTHLLPSLHQFGKSIEQQRGTRSNQSNWESYVRPRLDSLGRDVQSPNPWGMVNSEAMAAMALANSMDMQLYGFAKSRCEQIANSLNHDHHENAPPIQIERVHSLNCPPCNTTTMNYLMILSCCAVLGISQLCISRLKQWNKRRYGKSRVL